MAQEKLYDQKALDTILNNTDPETLKQKYGALDKNSTNQSLASDMWRLKKDGEMNYDKKGLRTSAPNIVIGAYNRDFQRNNDTKQFYQDIKQQYLDEQERKKKEREDQMNFQRGFINNHVIIAFEFKLE